MGRLTNAVRTGLGLRSTQQRPRGFSALSTAYQAAQINRLTEDWVVALLSPDQELRVALKNVRARARQLAINNPHCARFLNSAREQVIGSTGVALELSFPAEFSGTGVSTFSRVLEKAFSRWGELPTADQKMELTELAQLWLTGLLQDGESFVHKMRGYPHNASQFALHLIDPDQCEVSFSRTKSPSSKPGENEIRMGVEVDEFRRSVAYWLHNGHPSEAQWGMKRVPAAEIDHAFAMLRVNQTRGISHMHAAMFLMNMLGEYDKAELVASRWAACKMAFLISKTGDEYGKTGEDGKDGPMIVDATPGMFEELPEGIEPRVVDWQHPTQNYETFSLACLRAAATGLNTAYSTLTGDLRAVNFSSIRQGILSERDSWAVLQARAVNHFYRPLFRAWLEMAVLTNQVQLVRGMEIEDVLAAAMWTPRGWDWVDPNKDVQASKAAVGACLSTLQRECAKRGLDWRKVMEQRKAEEDYAKELGVGVDLSTAGVGADAEEAEDEGAAPPSKKPQKSKPNGSAGLHAMPHDLEEVQ